MRLCLYGGAGARDIEEVVMNKGVMQWFRLLAGFVAVCVFVPQAAYTEAKYRIVVLPKIMGIDCFDATIGLWLE